MRADEEFLCPFTNIFVKNAGMNLRISSLEKTLPSAQNVAKTRRAGLCRVRPDILMALVEERIPRQPGRPAALVVPAEIARVAAGKR
jgi:hypothetical protein